EADAIREHSAVRGIECRPSGPDERVDFFRDDVAGSSDLRRRRVERKGHEFLVAREEEVPARHYAPVERVGDRGPLRRIDRGEVQDAAPFILAIASSYVREP